MEPATEDLDLIRDFKHRASDALPGRVVDVVLFGSRARGDFEPDSDWDVAVFLNEDPSWDDRRTLSDICYDILMETEAYIQHVPLAARRRNEETLLLKFIREDGVRV